MYPHRRAVPRQVWVRLFGSAEREIAILAYSALFLAEDAGILRILADKGRAGVTVRIALGDPDGPHAAQRGEEEGTATPRPPRSPTALTPTGRRHGANIQIRLDCTRAVQLHLPCRWPVPDEPAPYGIPAAQAPAFCLCDPGGGEMAALYRDSFERVWASAAQSHRGAGQRTAAGKGDDSADPVPR